MNPKTTKSRLSLLAAIIAVAIPLTPAVSQADSITTIFASNNGGFEGGGFYFDILVGPRALTITSLEANTEDPGASAGFNIYTILGTSAFGSETNLAAWTLAATGTLTSAGLNNPSTVALASSFVLNANSLYGIALIMPAAFQHNYTNGDGTNESYTNGALTLTMGTATNVPFSNSAGLFDPRVWNGTITYNVGATKVPEPGTLTLLGIGLLGMGLVRRRKKA